MAELQNTAPVALPRVAITYCTQCRWLLRAAYFGQELLSTFGTSVGEIALIPATGGTFTVYLTYKPNESEEPVQVLLWDRKAEGGFPETKILKQRVRNYIEPEKNLGHSDTPAKSKAGASEPSKEDANTSAEKEAPAAKESGEKPPASNDCEDCK